MDYTIKGKCSDCGAEYETVVKNDTMCPNCRLNKDIKGASKASGDGVGGCRCGCPSSIAVFPNKLKF